ncbi:hypothetical protein PG994_004528 [Apiospora phragmitis]|uniref:Uncharacterized protein n=1 Tax=Apiospora phragmitis TaxID=2905665 RepID=A0ABR1VQV1_9PEZI
MSDTTKLDESMLTEFKKTYTNNVLVTKHYVDKTLQILNDSQTGLLSKQILHTPIASRMKTLDSAIVSLQRRQAARHRRAELKECLEGHNESWREYWYKRGQEHTVDDIDHFMSLGVFVYASISPGDIERVVGFLHDHSDIEVERVVPPGRRAAQDIRELEQYLISRDNDAFELKQWRNDGRNPAKYLATHLIVKFRGSGDGPQGNPVVVEI